MKPQIPTGPDDKGLDAYHVLRVAVEVFGKQPSDLKPKQLQTVHKQAGKTRDLEDLVLTTPEAGRVTVPSAAVDAAVEQVKSRYDDDIAFETAMRDSGLMEHDLRRALWRELAFDAVVSLVGDGAEPVTDEEIEAFYQEHPERFEKPELRTARHILITINPEYPDNTPKAARQRIDELCEELKAHPEKFAELALKHSECPTALDEGLLGQVPRGKLYDNLDAVLFNLDEGEVGGPVETESGFHLVLCEQVEPGSSLSLDQAREKIRAYLTQQRRRAKQKAWLATLKA